MSTMLFQQGVSDTYDRRLSGICIIEDAVIDGDAGVVMIARQSSYSCRYYICNILHERPSPWECKNRESQFKASNSIRATYLAGGIIPSASSNLGTFSTAACYKQHCASNGVKRH